MKNTKYKAHKKTINHCCAT